MQWYLAVLKKYTVFTGRARRQEFWMFFLFNVIISVVLSVVASFAKGLAILSVIYSLAVLLPGIAVAIRRMHDTDRSGWWLFVPIVPIVFALTAGTSGENKFGADPKAVAQQ